MDNKENKTYATTDSLEYAISNDYIGELMLYPDDLAQRMHIALTGKYYPPIMVYYYGKPDDELKEKFNYLG